MSAHEERERQGREARAKEERIEQEREVEAQGGARERSESPGGHEGEVKAQGEQEEDAKSLHEESHMSNRHMTWWQKSWWVRIDNGPHLRTVRGRRRAWRAATRAAREMRATQETQCESGEAERERPGKWEGRESNTLHIVLHLSTST